jgi:hypothetical protein
MENRQQVFRELYQYVFNPIRATRMGRVYNIVPIEYLEILFYEKIENRMTRELCEYVFNPTRATRMADIYNMEPMEYLEGI